MRTFLYCAFIIAVLLVSGFARASVDIMSFAAQTKSLSQTLPITDVYADYQKLALEISGLMSNPCQKPAIEIHQDKLDPQVLILKVTSPVPTDYCPAPVRSFRIYVRLPEVVKKSSLVLSDKSLYVVKTEGYEFSMEVSGSELLR